MSAALAILASATITVTPYASPTANPVITADVPVIAGEVIDLSGKNATPVALTFQLSAGSGATFGGFIGLIPNDEGTSCVKTESSAPDTTREQFQLVSFSSTKIVISYGNHTKIYRQYMKCNPFILILNYPNGQQLFDPVIQNGDGVVVTGPPPPPRYLSKRSKRNFP